MSILCKSTAWDSFQALNVVFVIHSNMKNVVQITCDWPGAHLLANAWAVHLGCHQDMVLFLCLIFRCLIFFWNMQGSCTCSWREVLLNPGLPTAIFSVIHFRSGQYCCMHHVSIYTSCFGPGQGHDWTSENRDMIEPVKIFVSSCNCLATVLVSTLLSVQWLLFLLLQHVLFVEFVGSLPLACMRWLTWITGAI